MTTASRTLADLIAVLAAAEVECLHLRPSASRWRAQTGGYCYACADQEHPGRIPRFRDKDGRALFRMPCDILRHLLFPEASSELSVTSWAGNADVCRKFGCCGWLPLPEADVHMEALVLAAWEIDRKTRTGSIGDDVVSSFIEEGMLGAAHALVAALEEEHRE